MHHIALRVATIDDAPAIDVIEIASFTAPAERFTPRRVRYVLSSPRLQTLVAEQDTTLLGWIAGFVHSASPQPWARIYALAIDPTARGRRIGQRLVEALIERFGQRGARRCFLEVRVDNLAAIKLYEKLGFKACKKLPGYYGPGVDAIRMARAIASSTAASS